MDKKEFIITIAKELTLGYKPYTDKLDETCNGFIKIARAVEKVYDEIKTSGPDKN